MTMLVEDHAARIQDDPSLSPITWLCISDVTDGHAVEGFRDGRALDADGKEVLILIVSKRFETKSLIQRQRMINKVFFDDLKTGTLHSVRMKCLTPDQWERRGKPRVFRPGAPCSISNQQPQQRLHHRGIPSARSDHSESKSEDESDNDDTEESPKTDPPPSFCVCGEHAM